MVIHTGYEFIKESKQCVEDRTPPVYEKYYEYEKEAYFEDMTDNEMKIRQRFTTFVTQTFDSLEKSTITDDQLKRFILTYFTTMEYYAVDEIDNEFKDADSLNAIHSKLAKHYSFCNYSVFESLIDVYGTDEDKENLKSYEECFKEFCFVVYNNRVCGSDVPGKCSVTFKLSVEPDKLKGEDLQRIKQRICKILDIKCASLYLRRIRDGCLQFDFLVSEVVCKHICHLTEEMSKKFFDDNITFIQVYNPVNFH